MSSWDHVAPWAFRHRALVAAVVVVRVACCCCDEAVVGAWRGGEAFLEDLLVGVVNVMEDVRRIGFRAYLWQPRTTPVSQPVTAVAFRSAFVAWIPDDHHDCTDLRGDSWDLLLLDVGAFPGLVDWVA